MLRLIPQSLVNYFNGLKHIPTETEALQHYYGRKFLELDVLKRFFNLQSSPETLQQIHVLLARVLQGEQIQAQENQLALSLIRQTMLIENDQGCLEFPTPLHRRFWFRLAYPSRAQGLPTGDIDEFILLVLSTFDPANLRERMSHSSSSSSSGNNKPAIPYEGVFQHSFWRGASFYLPLEYGVAAEVSRVSASDEKDEQDLDGNPWFFCFAGICIPLLLRC
jgi:hypothetical protein